MQLYLHLVDTKFPGSLKALREKFPRGTLVQLRVLTEAGAIVEFCGVLEPRDGPFDRLVETLRGDTEAEHEKKVMHAS